ncbi:YciI family protein [Micromonospora sp. NBC_01796]|uniref:YciI family protein n=1 Tax=Micromonospora sp. NBC_01796 TaxID=2975987 RepID=UPI002DD94135|nr:YciI family protein [Micromonospora sp. NBC_01796]WSA87490.1 YciI family protein [Micromonospora sp. NBC_01796]
MKFLLLIYSNPENWEHPMFLRNPEFLAMPAAEREALTEQAEALGREISESDELVVAAALADPVTTRTVRVRDNVLTTTDGPYLETKEQLAGYDVLDCESMERAIEIASRIPDARFGAVEIHPIMDMSGLEM